MVGRDVQEFLSLRSKEVAREPDLDLKPPVLSLGGVWSVSKMNPIDCDVLASGGGMAGSVAAIAAARQGARTRLFERHGFLGGAATAGASSPASPRRSSSAWRRWAAAAAMVIS